MLGRANRDWKYALERGSIGEALVGRWILEEEGVVVGGEEFLCVKSFEPFLRVLEC